MGHAGARHRRVAAHGKLQPAAGRDRPGRRRANPSWRRLRNPRLERRASHEPRRRAPGSRRREARARLRAPRPTGCGCSAPSTTTPSPARSRTSSDWLSPTRGADATLGSCPQARRARGSEHRHERRVPCPGPARRRAELSRRARHEQAAPCHPPRGLSGERRRPEADDVGLTPRSASRGLPSGSSKTPESTTRDDAPAPPTRSFRAQAARSVPERTGRRITRLMRWGKGTHRQPLASDAASPILSRALKVPG